MLTEPESQRNELTNSALPNNLAYESTCYTDSFCIFIYHRASQQYQSVAVDFLFERVDWNNF